jgi:hypothetical protein
MRKADQWKHVICLEGPWDGSLRGKSSVQPILELIAKQYRSFKFIYKDCATGVELKWYLNKWRRGYEEYPVLYLAFHGEDGCIKLGDGSMTTDDLGELLSGSLSGRIVVFGSCSTLNIDKRHIKRFIKNTDCLAVCGYKSDVDWMKSTAFELLMLEAMQENEFSGRGIGAIKAKLMEISKGFVELDFRMVTSQE